MAKNFVHLVHQPNIRVHKVHKILAQETFKHVNPKVIRAKRVDPQRGFSKLQACRLKSPLGDSLTATECSIVFWFYLL